MQQAARFRAPFARSLIAFDTSVMPWRRHVGITVPRVARDRFLGLSRDGRFQAESQGNQNENIA
jgi:hypothetical protein